MVIYATTAGGISVGSLFLAGYLPGALLAIVLMIGSYIISVKENYPKGSPFSIKGFVKQLGTSIWALAAVCLLYTSPRRPSTCASRITTPMAVLRWSWAVCCTATARPWTRSRR